MSTLLRENSTYTSQETSEYESYLNYIKYRNLLLENKGKYDYLIIDGISDLDSLSEIGATFAYMDTIVGKSFNRVEGKRMGLNLTLRTQIGNQS